MEDYDKRLQTIQRHFWKKFIKGRDYKEQKASTMKLLYTDRPNRETARQTLPPLSLPLPLCLCPWPYGLNLQTNKQTDRQTYSQTDRQTDRQAGRQAERERGRKREG